MRQPVISSNAPEGSLAVQGAAGATAGSRLPFVFEPLTRWAQETPEQIAILSDGVAWTYAEAESKANQLAHALISHGVKRGDRVSFVLPRGPETVLTLISILKTGAAYVPLDSESPPSRVKECLEDARPALVIGLNEEKAGVVEAALGDLESGDELVRKRAPIVTLSQLWKEAESQPTAAPAFDELTEDDLAYVIFTSGTTGRPKGVPIKHASLSNFVWGDQEVCIKVSPQDRVFQGFSPASDGHHEEVWPTLLAGATLVVATSREIHSGPELYAFLAGHEVTIISCAPTLLSMVDDDIPTLRRILFGAENLPAATVERWWKPGREVINTYGPTEATVGATFGYCEPGKPITIGKPLPGYSCYVLDGDQKPVAQGEEGELWVAGVGISDGYFGRPDLSLSRFVPDPFATSESTSQRDGTMYRTGDRVKLEESGNLVWLGRVDAQIKIRGHRVELSEIEGHLVAEPSVSAAVVVAREGADHQISLVALLALRDSPKFDLGSFLQRLRDDLPAYMVPAGVELVDKIPVLPSGKVDRRACQALNGRPVRIERAIVPPRSDAERMVLEAWQELFHTQEISCTDDFFTGLGGYSLLASRFVSFLRSDKGYPQVSVLDLYENPTIRSFAAHLESQETQSESLPPFRPVVKWRYRKAKAVQAVGVLVLFGIQGFFWLGPIIAAIYFSNNGLSDFSALFIGLTMQALTVPALLLLTIALKWIVGGRFKEGRYPIWGTTFLRWWFVDRMLATAPATVLTGTPFASLYLRALGAKVGKNVTFENLEVSCPDLIEVGDDCTLENSAWLHPEEVARGELCMRPIKIGRGCMIGVRGGVAGGAVLEEGVTLRDLTCVPTGVTVPAYEEWGGSPARKAEDPKWEKYDPAKQPSQSRIGAFAVVQALGVLVLTYIESLPFIAVAFTMYNREEFLSYIKEPIYAVAMVLFACAQALLIKWVILGKLKTGSFPNPGWYAIRKWFTDKHLELVSAAIVPVYDSLFARIWCMALGMKCGPRCEIALPRRLPYDLVEMGEESFWASEVSIGMPFRRNGELRFESTKIGNRAFLGNDSVLPQGCQVPDESLMGVLSLWPPASETGVGAGQAWLGSPAFRMPQRHANDQFDVRLTYKPTKRLYVERLVHEAFRIVLPSLCSLIVASLILESFVWVWNETSLGWAIVAGPFLYLFGALVGAGLCWLAKVILVGKYKPGMSPLWSPFVWKAETYSSVLHDFGATLFIRAIEGTPYLATLMRFLGAKIGRRAFINTSDWTETDLISVGTDAAVNANAPLQAHLFEDRVMKMGPIKVGDRASIGNYSVVLGDSEVKQDAQVGHMSLVMKGETIPAGTYWSGSPAQAGHVPLQPASQDS